MGKVSIAIFVSGSGTNCENLIKYFAGSERVNCALVVSNKPDAYALVRAERLGVPTAVTPKAELNDPEVMMPLLKKYNIGFIVLAGFLPLVPTFLIDAYPHRIINIHPALLPKYGGKGFYGEHVHEAVVAAKEPYSGITVHYVNELYDSGEIILQAHVALDENETPDSLAAKIHQLEQAYFPVAIEYVLESQN